MRSTAAAFNDAEDGARVAPVALEATVQDGALVLTLPPHAFATVELQLA